MEIRPIVQEAMNTNVIDTIRNAGWKLDWIFSTPLEKIIIALLLFNGVWDIFRLIMGWY